MLGGVRSGPARDRWIDVIDETFIDAPPHRLAALFRDPRNVANAWPHVQATVTRDRGVQGAVWSVSGAMTGEFEVWIEPYWDGAIVHHYVRASTAQRPAPLERAHVRRWKRFVTAVKDTLEPPRRSWSFEGGQSERPLIEPD